MKLRIKAMVIAVCRVVLPAVVGAVTLAGCNGGRTDLSDGGERLNVAVSIEPLRYFVSAVGGDSVDISVVMPRGADPETFEPGVTAMKKMHSADVLLTTGLLPFEKRIESAGSESTLRFGVSDGVRLIYGTHDAAHHGHGAASGDERHAHGEADPHVWSSVENARIIAGNVVEALVSADPEHGGYYRERGRMLQARLDSLAGVWHQRVAPKAGDAFVVWHPALSYFARENGLRQIALNVDNKENSSLRLRDVIEEARSQGARALFVAKGVNPAQTVTVAAELGVRPVEIDVMSSDWEGEMNKVVNAIAEPRR